MLATTRLGDEQIPEIAERKPTVVVNRELDGVTGVRPDVERASSSSSPTSSSSGIARRVPVGPADS